MRLPWSFIVNDKEVFTTRNEKNVPRTILQGNWVEQWGFEIGCSVSVECYQNKLVILKD